MRRKIKNIFCFFLPLCAICYAFIMPGGGNTKPAFRINERMDWICMSEDSTHFIFRESGEKFTPWGFNYDHDTSGRLLEDYWNQEWKTVEADFREMKELGANVVRIHLQLGKFMLSKNEPNQQALNKLGELLKLAERTGLYLDITGLGCYHKQDVPKWYHEMDEAGRWKVQAAFWSAVSKTCAHSPAVFCYDLMNEPLWPSVKKDTEWLAGKLGGEYFCQRITLDLKGRHAKEVANAWIHQLVSAIHSRDDRHLITLGVIPWALAFPGAKLSFYAKDVGDELDYLSVHFYPKKQEVSKAVKALKTYDVGKPLVIEEMFPLACDLSELDTFIDSSRGIADGWIGFYWGARIGDYSDKTYIGSLMHDWLGYFSKKAPDIIEKD